MTEEKQREELIKKLRWHQSQLHHFINLYYDKDRFTDSEREYYKKYTDAQYRLHLTRTAELQDKLNDFKTEAIF
jgi:hypothetical protein